ncbi:YnfC family lipoprotein [Providencia stuartii]|uniref:YnfC family lipoprotein n=1 Tax=Providencia stuartii TaxID=588 RepID=UPI001FF191B1|nr:YnfC family lipoprotein [Providencia stuartii]ELZ5940144.1 YnfC family lipoprotein [Providencia stuartii]MCK1145026.1 YnfC family lipoprotein [Providencia stuartii]
MMKFITFAFTLASLLMSTASAEKGYLPAIQNIYALYSGVLIKGPVKEINATFYTENNIVAHEINLKLDENSCIESFESISSAANQHIQLAREDNQLKGRSAQGEIIINLDDQCRFISQKDHYGTAYFEYNERGYIKSITNSRSDTIDTLVYSHLGELQEMNYYDNNQLYMQTIYTPIADSERYADIRIEQKMLGDLGYSVDRKCQYNPSGAPTTCQVLTTYDVDGKMQTQKQSLVIETQFYEVQGEGK